MVLSFFGQASKQHPPRNFGDALCDDRISAMQDFVKPVRPGVFGNASRIGRIRIKYDSAIALDSEALATPGHAPLAIAFFNDFTLSAGARPGFDRCS
jgi:hypothetical protein